MNPADSSGKEQERKQATVPVIAYKTLRGFIDALRVTMPDRIDRSIMHSYSGGVQAQLVHALKAMHLTGANGAPTETLKTLARSDGPERQAIMAAILKNAYPFLFSEPFSLKSATGRQLIDAFSGTGISGDTVRKAIAFFLAAAKDSGLSVSPYFKKLQLRGSRPVSRRANGNKPEAEEEPDGGMDDAAERKAGSMRRITLRGGGSATLSFDVDVWSMTPDDQEFVFGMIKRMNEYEQKKNSEV